MRTLALLFALTLLLSITVPAPASATWVENGLPVSAVAGDQSDSVAMPDGSGGAFVAWWDTRSGAENIYAQRIDTDGNPLWTAGGVPVCTATDIQFDVQMISDGVGGIILGWSDGRPGVINSDIYAQRLNGSGAPLWAADGVAVCNAANLQYESRIVSDGAGGAILSWQDKRVDSLGDIYAQRINSAGTPLWTANGVGVCTDANQQSTPRAASDGSGGIIITWWDGRFSDFDAFANRLDANGNVLWSANGLNITGEPGTDETSPEIVGHGDGTSTVVWRDYRSDTSGDLYAVGLDASGNWLYPPSSVTSAAGQQNNVELARDPATGDVIVVWQDGRGAGGWADVYAQRFDSTGKMQWNYNGLPIGAVDASSQLGPRLAVDAAGYTTIAWEETRFNPLWGIYAQRVSPTGELEWAVNGVVVTETAGTKRNPVVIDDNSGGFLVIWDERKTGDEDLYVQRIEATHGFWGHPEPAITGVSDIPGDQGNLVQVNWTPSNHDFASAGTISHYSVWRATDAIPKAAAEVTLAQLAAGFSGAAYRVAKSGDFYWEYLGQQTANALPGYSYTAATRNNSQPHWFQVVTHTDDQFVVFPSVEVSGTSVDNLAPAAPQSLAAMRSGGTNVVLSWTESLEPDLEQYAIYRSNLPSVAIEPGNFLAYATTVTAVDATADLSQDFYYLVVAIDVNNNASDPSNEAMVANEVTAVPETVFSFRVLPNSPNPFGSGGTMMQYQMPTQGEVRIELFDIRGRRVHAWQETAHSGLNLARWNGRNADGSEVPSGMYFYRVTAGEKSMTQKMLLQR